MSVGEDFLKRIKEAGGRQKLIDELGIAPQTISGWRNKNSLPEADRVFAIAKCLGVRVCWLITGKDEDALTDDQRELLEKYRQLGESDRRVASDLIQSLLREANSENKMTSSTTFIRIVEPDTEGALSATPVHVDANVKIVDSGYVYIPLRGKTAAGKPIDITEEPLAMVLYPKALVPGNTDDYFCLEVAGTSMTEVGINDGDMVLIKTASEPVFGKIMLVRYENTSTLKRVVKRDGRIFLCWEYGSGMEVEVNSESYAVEGLLVRISKLPE